MEEDKIYSYMDVCRTDTDTDDDFPIPIVYQDSNIRRCQIIDFVKGWDSTGCQDPIHREEIGRILGRGLPRKQTYTRVFYECPTHGYVNDNLYFGSEEERTGICKCYLCISDEFERVSRERMARDLEKKKKAEERIKFEKQQNRRN